MRVIDRVAAQCNASLGHTCIRFGLATNTCTLAHLVTTLSHLWHTHCIYLPCFDVPVGDLSNTNCLQWSQILNLNRKSIQFSHCSWLLPLSWLVYLECQLCTFHFVFDSWKWVVDIAQSWQHTHVTLDKLLVSRCTCDSLSLSSKCLAESLVALSCVSHSMLFITFETWWDWLSFLETLTSI